MRKIISCCFVIATLTITSPAFAILCIQTTELDPAQCFATCARHNLLDPMAAILCT